MTDGPRTFVCPPCAALRPLVKRFLVVEYAARHRDAHLPGTGFVAAFRLAGECQLDGAAKAPDAALTGLWDVVRSHDHSHGNTVALVQFTAMGASVFLRESLDAFLNATVSLDEVWGRNSSVRRLHERLVAAPDHGRRIRALEEFLLKRIGDVRPDPLVAAAISWFERAGPRAQIGTLVSYIGLSQSALERRFRRHVGTSPRQFASLLRLQEVLRLRKDGNNFTAIAHAAGYFDQAHFINDFKRFAGQSPEAYFARAAT